MMQLPTLCIIVSFIPSSCSSIHSTSPSPANPRTNSIPQSMEESHFRQKRKQLMLQNCDLPPPTNPCYLYQDNCDLTEALHRSQKRAKEAERMRDEAIKEKSHAINALLSESMRLMAYRRYLMMLEFQLHNFKSDQEEEEAENAAAEKGGKAEKWKVGLIIFVGLAGLGFALAFPFLP